MRLSAAEQVLTGQALTNDALGQAAGAASAEVDPNSDVHATAAYRRKLAGVMAKRAVQQAATRAGGGT